MSGARVLGPYRQHNGWRVVEIGDNGRRTSSVFKAYERASRYADLLREELARLDSLDADVCPPSPRPDGGFVYFVGQGEFVKIGKTQDIRARLRQLQTASPVRLRLLAWAWSPTPEQMEADLHTRASGQRVSGEWFRRGRVVADLIREVQRC